MAIIIEIALFILMLWLGRFVCRKCLKRQQRLLAYVWMIFVIIVQAVIIYYFVGDLTEQMTSVLKMFYNEA
ncbi:MAG: hypothetical protein Q4F01_03405 [Staphylococcus rostri]|nr:hypothetical protein [Staphylococcus rostri]MDO5375212.1 hypothetical protein [Staphylococcus rostri]